LALPVIIYTYAHGLFKDVIPERDGGLDLSLVDGSNDVRVVLFYAATSVYTANSIEKYPRPPIRLKRDN
jgi:hypothetical protein